MFKNILSKKDDTSKGLFDFKQFLMDNGWKKVGDNYFVRGYKSIKFVSNSSIMIALNRDKKVKYNHIVTCKVPNDFNEADVLTNLTYLR